MGTLWMGWHFTFLTDLSAIIGPGKPVWVVWFVFVLASWGFGDAAEQTKAVLVVACLHEAGNLVSSPVALGVIALSWTLLLIFWNRPVVKRLTINKRSWFGRLAALCLATTLVLSAGYVIAQTDSTYGTVPHGEILLDQPNSFPVFDDAFYENRLFLLGEVHGMQKPQELDFALLKHLNGRVGVRYYIAEVDAVKAHYLNEYLKTGDTLTLNKVFRSWIAEKMQWANRDFYRKIGRIRVLNQTLPEARRICFVGIDRIQDKPLVAERLKELLRGRELPKTARLLADSLVNRLAQNRPDSVVADAAQAWLDTWQNATASYNRAFGRDTASLRQLLTNVLYLKTIKSREKTIFANFQTLLPSLNNEKLYGFWGFFHVLQQPTLTRGKPFACLAKELGIPVVSITCSYLDSYMMLPGAYRTDKLNNDGELMRTEGIDAMRAVTRPNTLTLFALDRPGSFARQTPIRIKYGPFMPPSQRMKFDPKRPVTDYFQYVILVRNSDMTKPLVP